MNLGLAFAAASLLPLLAVPAWAAHELDNRDIARGQSLYADHCAACHGADLKGQPDWRSPGPDG
ncbi:MAG: c-type cytochrome, partial [Silicimonas sp.]|nr:c-type cytochrome [Silicimonas sp.]